MARVYRFGVFLFDADQLELTRDGRSVRLQRQPAQVLATLLERSGHLVTRDQLHRAVWRDDTFVDFERGLNFCIAQIRIALADDAGTPRYIRTSPKKGYEFICPVVPVDPVAFSRAATVGSADTRPDSRRQKHTRRGLIAAGALVAILALGAAYYAASGRSDRVIVAVARFDNETGDPELTRFSDYLTDSVVEQLTIMGVGRYEVIGNAAILRRPREQRDLGAIGSSLHASYVVLGQLQRDAQRVRVLGHLIRLPEQTHVTVSRFDDIQDRTLARASELAIRMARAFDASHIPATR
jgi:DNA-binding winged helix-turn-helix (wHTH) protein/TolB-like protein